MASLAHPLNNERGFNERLAATVSEKVIFHPLPPYVIRKKPAAPRIILHEIC